MGNGAKTLAETGELAFIERIRKAMPSDGGIFLRSVGDDCLITESFGDNVLLATTDAFVDTVHFTRDFFTFEQAGRRCMSAAVSDIAAMAGIPVFSLLSLSMPKDELFDDAVSLFEGLARAAADYGCPVAGGETTSTPGPLTVTVTVIGKAGRGCALTRSGARPGDSIYITGTIGDAMAGLEAYMRGVRGYDTLKRKYIDPSARVELSHKLAGSYHLTAMIDVSDGVSTDLGHICEESRCGAELYAAELPLSDEFRDFAEKNGIDPVQFALTSGEEFELLFTSDDASMPEHFTIGNCPVTRIGRMSGSEDGIRLRFGDSTVVVMTGKGYEHFRS